MRFAQGEGQGMACSLGCGARIDPRLPDRQQRGVHADRGGRCGAQQERGVRRLKGEVGVAGTVEFLRREQEHPQGVAGCQPAARGRSGQELLEAGKTRGVGRGKERVQGGEGIGAGLQRRRRLCGKSPRCIASSASASARRIAGSPNSPSSLASPASASSASGGIGSPDSVARLSADTKCSRSMSWRRTSDSAVSRSRASESASAVARADSRRARSAWTKLKAVAARSSSTIAVPSATPTRWRWMN
ncbi:MAG TPA: hypothetical protein PLK29_00675 [Chiayiivirga sp.]|nr:hypothetical protein [Chiayiivirga sp.]